MSSNINVDIRIMQDNLCDLRKIAGWTAEILAGKLGITKQSISNLENQKVKLTRIQYIAIRSVFECEIASNSDNTTLRKVMSILFEVMPPVYEDRKEELRIAMRSIASIAASGLTGMQLYCSAMALLAPLGSAVVQIKFHYTGEPSLRWLLEALGDSKSISTENEKRVVEDNDENNRDCI